MEMKLGGSYVVTVVLTEGGTGALLEENYQVGFHEITSPNSVHMLWYAFIWNELPYNFVKDVVNPLEFNSKT